ncbi:MAG: ABC transporter transmembrane domain-containing protein [Actinomycetota bacterium]
MKSRDLRLLLSREGGRRLIIFSIVAAIVSSGIVLTNAILIAQIVTRIISHEVHVQNLIYCLGGLWFFRAIFIAQFDYWSSCHANKIKRKLRSGVTSKLGDAGSISSAELSNLLTKGLNSLDIYLGRFIPQMVAASITPIIVIATLFYEDILSGVIALLTLPLIPIFGALIGKYSAESVAKKWRTLGTLSRYFEDSLRGFATLKIFGRDKTQSARIHQMGDRYTEETMKF